MFSKSCEYGIQAILYVAQNSRNNRKIGLKEIADAQKIPSHFLSKVLQILVKKKFLQSAKGMKGGYTLKKNADDINLLEIINAIDGMELFNTCVLGLNDCSEYQPCPIHDQYKVIKEGFLKILSGKTLKRLADDLSQGKAFISNSAG